MITKPTFNVEDSRCFHPMHSSAPMITLNQVSLSTMEALQPNLLTKILEFCTLPDILVITAASTTLRRAVNKNCSSLWRHLDFGSLPANVRSRLTDKSLARLLKRVNAKHVTETISLASCCKVDGSGLSPLRHSPFLKSVDLRRHSPEPNEERRAVRELRTMIHHALCHVRFNEPIAPYPCGVTNLLRDLHAAKLKQALQNKLKCHGCGDSVTSEAMQLVPNVTGVPPNQCVECEQHFCLGNECPVKLEICVSCMQAKCTNCLENNSILCDVCAHSYCKDCANATLGKCVGCKEVSCAACRSSTCATCNNSFCSHCVKTESPIISCFSCNKDYCFQCREVLMCTDCEQWLCETCVEVKRCGYCSGHFCITCRDVTSMPNGSGGTIDVCAKCQDKMMELL